MYTPQGAGVSKNPSQNSICTHAKMKNKENLEKKKECKIKCMAVLGAYIWNMVLDPYRYKSSETKTLVFIMSQHEYWDSNLPN